MARALVSDTIHHPLHQALTDLTFPLLHLTGCYRNLSKSKTTPPLRMWRQWMMAQSRLFSSSCSRGGQLKTRLKVWAKGTQEEKWVSVFVLKSTKKSTTSKKRETLFTFNKNLIGCRFMIYGCDHICFSTRHTGEIWRFSDARDARSCCTRANGGQWHWSSRGINNIVL